MKFYYDKSKLLNKELYCLGIDLDESKIENFAVYESELPFIGYPIIEGNILRPATLQELVNLKEIILKDGEKISEDEIVCVPIPDYYYEWNREKFIWEANTDLLKDGDYIERGKLKTSAPPQDLLKPIWNRENKLWEEGASNCQIVSNNYNNYMKLNNARERDRLQAKNLLIQFDNFLNECESFLYKEYSNVSVLPEMVIPEPSRELKEYYLIYECINNELKTR